MQIDALITWVDSSDEAWRLKINEYLPEKIDWNNKENSTRFNSINEIEICILSILKFATYFKNIYIVTDNQQPENFEKLNKVALSSGVNLELIDHKVIFKGYEEYLPTFNSRTIEKMVYRIPNLSEHFVYFNDDTFLINKTKPSDFFIDNLPVLRGRWVKNKGVVISEKDKASHKYAKEHTANFLGYNQKYYNFHHTPQPFRKSTIKKYLETNPSVLRENLKYKFRHKNQFLLQILINHIEIKNKTCVLTKKLALAYTHSYGWFKILKRTFKTDLKGDRILFLCLQSLETVEDKKLRYLLRWIDKKLDSNFENKLQ